MAEDKTKPTKPETTEQPSVLVDGEKAIVETPHTDLPKTVTLPDPLTYKIEDFLNILLALRTTLKTVSTAPTSVPRSFNEQIVIYSSGGTYRLYVYIVGIGWKSTTLT